MTDYISSCQEIKDISGKECVIEKYNDAETKLWIKLILASRTIPLDEYNRREYFILVANIVLDNDMNKDGKKKRNTVIKFDPTIPKQQYDKKNEWLYLLVINDRIVKIGGTRTGLKNRIGSYLCGHHVQERGKSGHCSNTNGYIYNTLEFYLQLGCEIKMYGYNLPQTEVSIDIFGQETKIMAQTYHAYESAFLEDYKKNYNEYPILSDNCDPEYKK